LRRAIQIGLFVWTLLAASLLAASAKRGAFNGWARLPPSTWGAIAVALLLWLVLDWLRFGSLLALLGFRLRPWLAVQLTCASYFVSTLTPSAELSVPTMAWMLHREGLDPARAAGAAMVKSLYMTLWICAIGFGSLLLFGGALPAQVSRKVTVASLWLIVPVTLFALVLAFPRRVLRWGEAKSTAGGWRSRLAHALGRAAGAIASLGRSTHPYHLACHATAIASVFLYVALGQLIAASLGIDLSWARALTAFSNGLVVAYLAPVPGSIGVTELATAYLIDPALSGESIAVAVVLRSICWYGPAVAGGAVLWRWAWTREAVA
jgi:uncharacterized membrane protein YbhN (UPF0104 family)